MLDSFVTFFNLPIWDNPLYELAALLSALYIGYQWGHGRATKHAAKTLWMGVRLGELVNRMEPGESRMITVRRSEDGGQVELSWLKTREEMEPTDG